MARPARLYQSVEALYSYLLFFIDGGVDDKTVALVESLRSQNQLAKFEHMSRGIMACSLNAQKLSAETCIDGGYVALNNLRLRAVEVASRISAPSKNAKSELIKKAAILQSQLNVSHQENCRLTIAINELIDLAYKVAGDDVLHRKIVAKEILDITARFGI